MERFKLKGSQLTVLLMCLIVIASYFSVPVIAALLPSSKNQMLQIEKPSEAYILNFSDSDMGLNPLPLSLIEQAGGSPLTKQTVEKINKTYVQKVIYKLLYRDIINTGITMEQLFREDQSLQYDEMILDELGYAEDEDFLEAFVEAKLDGQAGSYYIFTDTITTKVSNKTYQISCVIEENGKLWSYHCEEKRERQGVSQTAKEKAYYHLADMVSNRDEKLTDYLQYLKYIMNYYGQNQPIFQEVITKYMQADPGALEYYQIITTDSELLLVFTGEKSFILCFDPIILDFSGIYFEI